MRKKIFVVDVGKNFNCHYKDFFFPNRESLPGFNIFCFLLSITSLGKTSQTLSDGEDINFLKSFLQHQ